MISVENFLFTLLERGTHSLQRRFHRTNFWLAKWYATIDAFIIFYGALLHNRSGNLSAIDIVFMPLFFALTFLFANYYWKVEERKAFARLEKGQANPRKISRDWAMMRFFFLFLTVAEIALFTPLLFQIALGGILFLFLSILILLLLLLFATLAPFFYLIACDPLPPSAEKHRAKSKHGAPAPVVGG